MSSPYLTVTGIPHVTFNMVRLASRTPVLAQRSLHQEAAIELVEMKKRTPVRSGELKKSGRVVDDTAALGIGVRFLFGNALVDYALPVHEDLEAIHHVGQAKYMESVLDEFEPVMPVRVARRLKALLGT